MAAPSRSAVASLAAAAGVPLAAYVWALHPGLAAGDSGELVTAAVTGGVAHPPGYPLYTMLGGLWLHAWPHASPAWALNLFSAVCMAAAAGVLAGAVRRARGSWLAGVLAAWAFATCPAVFTNALVADVFALHALLAAFAMLALVSTPAAGAVALAGLSTLALSHHHTLLLLTVPAFVACAGRALAGGEGRGALVLSIVAAALAGLLPLLWLPIAGANAHALVWGEPGTFRGFVSLLLRAEYGAFRLDPRAAGQGTSAAPFVAFARALPGALTWPGLALSAIGGWRLWTTRREAAIALAATAVLAAWFLTPVGDPTNAPSLVGAVERFQILPLLVLGFLLGRGAMWVVTALARGAWGQEFLFAVLLALMFAFGTTRAPGLSQRGNRVVETLGRDVLASVPQGGVLFTRGDVVHNALTYLQRVQHERPDVTTLDQVLMAYPWYVRQLRTRRAGVLPPLDLAQRITMADGRGLEGVAVARADSTTDLLTEDGQQSVPSASVASVQKSSAASLYAATHARLRHTPWLDVGEDRYSGLPGSRNLLWFDALRESSAVCVLGLMDSSYALRYRLAPHGAVQQVLPR